MDRLEQVLVENVVEGETFHVKVGSISLQIQKYSSDYEYEAEAGQFEDEETGSTVNFPISRVRKEGDRVSVSVVTYTMNPFFGSRYTDEKMLFAVISPLTFAVNYRNEDGDDLGTGYLKNLPVDSYGSTSASVDFQFNSASFDKRYFNKKVSYCAPFDESSSVFLPDACSFSFNSDKDSATCSCEHLSYYTLVEDYDERKPPVAPTFKDIPFVIASIYLVVFLLIGGLVFTINKDRGQQKEIQIAHKTETKQDEVYFDNMSAIYTLNAIAFYRKDIALQLTNDEVENKKISGSKLFALYYQMLHPLSGLYFSFDPALPKIFYFLTLYLRILVIYMLSFAMFKDDSSSIYVDPSQQGSASIVMILLFSLLCLPLPFWAL
jgi:hypothetical protein